MMRVPRAKRAKKAEKTNPTCFDFLAARSPAMPPVMTPSSASSSTFRLNASDMGGLTKRRGPAFVHMGQQDKKRINSTRNITTSTVKRVCTPARDTSITSYNKSRQSKKGGPNSQSATAVSPPSRGHGDDRATRGADHGRNGRPS